MRDKWGNILPGLPGHQKKIEIEMRCLLLTILFTVASGDAAAEWIKVGNSEMDTFYADPGSTIRTGNKVKMRALHDYKMPAKAAGSSFLSTEVQEEYDCEEKLSRTLSFTSYSRNSGKGKKVYADINLHGWESAKPDSVREALWKFACTK